MVEVCLIETLVLFLRVKRLVLGVKKDPAVGIVGKDGIPSRNAPRRSYLKLLLFLLRPMVFFIYSLVVGGVFRRPPSISIQDGVWG
jgi:hypothetical protein